MPTPNFWVFLLPALGGAVWGTEAHLDPGQMYYIGPAEHQLVGGLGGIFEATNASQIGSGEGTLAYAYGWRAFGFQPKFTTFVTARGDVVTGIGLQNEFVFKNTSLPFAGAGPLFFSWSAGPAFYHPAPAPRGNYGPPIQFQMVNELGFYVGRSMRVSVAYNHYSDGIHDNNNPNGNSFTFNLGYRF
jgi:hypothetical protein